MDEHVLDFLEKFAEGRHTEEEHARFQEWLKTASENEVIEALELYPYLTSLKKTATDSRLSLINKIENSIDASSASAKVFPIWRRVTRVAAVAVLLAGIVLVSLYFFDRRPEADNNLVAVTRVSSNIPPINTGSATLTLADGRTLLLDSMNNGVIAAEGGIRVRKTADGQIVYDASSSAEGTSRVFMHSIATSKGKQFRLSLPDGSEVWMNAGSTLKFPSAFPGDERVVELSGEAYFEVAPDKKKPFRVISEKQSIEVLGTHFNVYAYPDEVAVRTTLVEGSVRISLPDSETSRILKPGEQARLKDKLSVTTVDPFEVIAWKDGYLHFSDESIQSVMKKISRWYDVDVQFKGKVTNEEFVGKISRVENVSEVLKLLELTNSVHFQIQNRTITVLP